MGPLGPCLDADGAEQISCQYGHWVKPDMPTARTILDIGVIIITVLIMGSVGMELEGRNFRTVGQIKWKFLLTFAAQIVILPPLGFLLTRLLGLPVHISAGILLLAACPVGDIANLYTLLARGNVAFSVSMNAISCLMSVLTMALAFEVYDHLLHQHFIFSVPTPTLVIRLFLMIALPILGGMGIRHIRPEFVERQAINFRRASIAGVIFLLVYVLFAQQQNLKADWLQTALAGALFMGLALSIGYLFGNLLQLDFGHKITVAILFAVRNVGLATAIAVTLLGRVEWAVFGAVYFITEVPLLLAVVTVCRRKRVNVDLQITGTLDGAGE